MITEDYVSFETAKLLKEKGFNEETEYVYSNNGKLLRLCHFGIEDLTNTDCNDYHTWPFPIEDVTSIISAPTLQMAMKWLREVHYIFIYITPSLRYWGNEHKYDKEHPWFLEGYQPHVYHGDNPHEFRVIDKYYVSTYEEAVEAAIKYCLENLI